MCTDTSLSAIDIIRLYGLRFKIEHSFKQAASQIGSFAYHFWIKDMIPLLYRNGNQYLHRKSADYRSHVKRKINAYHVFIQAGLSLRDCSSISPSLLPSSFGSGSAPGSEPFVPTSPHRSSSLQTRCARHFPNFS